MKQYATLRKSLPHPGVDGIFIGPSKTWLLPWESLASRSHPDVVAAVLKSINTTREAAGKYAGVAPLRPEERPRIHGRFARGLRWCRRRCSTAHPVPPKHSLKLQLRSRKQAQQLLTPVF